MLHLIPKVKRLEIKEGYLFKKAIFCDTAGLDARLIAALGALAADEGGAHLSFSIGEDARDESYTLSVTEQKIRIEAPGVRGAFYAVQTLRQLFTEERVPCLYIEDKPDFAYRGFYHDITRGRVPTLKTLKALVDRMVYLKMNSLQLYVEHTYPFEECREIAERWGAITPQELRELDAYCRERFIDFIPSLSTFGHMYEILRKEPYRHLRVLSDFTETHNFRWERMRHHTINPEHPESLPLVRSLIGQYMPNFNSDYFNICCDETFDLEESLGERAGALYVDFVKKIINEVKSKGKTPMMWADILEKHPETIAELPEDTVFLSWDYSATVEKEKIEKISAFGRPQIVCPGTSSWSNLCESLPSSEDNIGRMAEYGYECGAIGVLNTNWGDLGNPCSLALADFGLTWGAEKSWSVSTEKGGEFYENIEHLIYKKNGAVALLKQIGALSPSGDLWNTLTNLYFNIRYGEDHRVYIQSLDFIGKRDALLEMLDSLSKEVWEEDTYRREAMIAVEGIAVTVELLAKALGKPVIRKTDTEAWLKKYREAWLRTSKESELEKIEEQFRFLDAM